MRVRLPFAFIVLELLVLLSIPRLYVDARCKSDAARLAALVQQSRFGETNILLRPRARLERKGNLERPASSTSRR